MTTTYKIIIDKPEKSQFTWSIIDNETFEPVTLGDSFRPKKLFPEDVFTYDPAICRLVIKHSVVRSMTNIPAVLIVDDYNTYGKYKKNDKSLYKCVPDDTRLPPFLVPYKIKHVGFFKDIPNIFVTIQYVDWDDKHPVGTIVQNIGTVDVLEHFFEYQLFCKSLNHSIQRFNKAADQALKNALTRCRTDLFDTIQGQFEDRRSTHRIFTIDPPGCTDFDDAFSISSPSPETGDCIISIYISNVPVVLDSLNLWSAFSQRVSTIYLPDKKRPMLPTILSDGLCSLQEGQSRIAYTIDVRVSESGEVKEVHNTSCKIAVFKNFAYEEKDLLSDTSYQRLFHLVIKLSKIYKHVHPVQNSHELVAYLMILMNNHCAKHLAEIGSGVFRATKTIYKPSQPLREGPEEVLNFIAIWGSTCGQYIDIAKCSQKKLLQHSALNLEEYVHITSPIRRIVDILNMILIQKNITFSDDAYLFVQNWLTKIDYINTTMRSIRKVQTDCDFLSLCMKDELVLASEYDGYCFDRVQRGDGLFQYNVFLPALKIAYRITSREYMEELDLRKYKLYLFTNENKYKKKIRLQVVNSI